MLAIGLRSLVPTFTALTFWGEAPDGLPNLEAGKPTATPRQQWMRAGQHRKQILQDVWVHLEH